MSDPFDPAGLSLRPTTARPPGRPPRHRPGGKFLKGPVPWAWLEAAAVLPGRALAVGLVVWLEAGCRGRRTVEVTLAKLSRPGWSLDTARRGLRGLEVAGLVTVARAPGRALSVTLNDPPDTPGPDVARGG